MGTGGPSPPMAPTLTLRLFADAIYKTVCTVLCHIIQLFKNGDPYEIRTRVAGVRGRSLRPLDQRAECGAPSGTRTRDTLIKSQVLYQLS